MQDWNLERWLGQIYATEDQEISCTECFDWVSDYVDRELAHTPRGAQQERVHQHLGQCRVCREEYEMLRELAALESADEAGKTD